MADDGVTTTPSPGIPSPAPGGGAGFSAASSETVRVLTERFGEQVEPVATPFEVPVVKVRPGALREVAAFLKEDGYALLLDVGGVDYLGRRPPDERFEVVYHLLDVGRLRRIRLRVVLPQDAPELPSVSDLWPSANWAEREVFDLFGIRFAGHPDLRRILMPEGWEGHPLRKDYPLRGPRTSGQPQALRQRFFPLRLDGPPEQTGPGEPLQPPSPAAAVDGAGPDGVRRDGRP